MEVIGKRSKAKSKLVIFSRVVLSRTVNFIEFLGPWTTIIIVSLLFGWWEFLARTGRVILLFFPAPSTIIFTMFDMLRTGVLVEDLIPTLRRVLSGFFIGGSVGLLVGLSMGWSKIVRTVLDPLIAALHPVPKISLLPVFLIIFGFGEKPLIVMISISAFFPILINSMAGVTQINPTYFEVAKNYGANNWKIFSRVVLPGSLPMILTGMRLSLTLSLVITLVIEMQLSNNGLGNIIWLAGQTLRTNNLYAVIVVLALLGISFNAIILWLRNYLVPWYQEAGK